MNEENTDTKPNTVAAPDRVQRLVRFIVRKISRWAWEDELTWLREAENANEWHAKNLRKNTSMASNGKGSSATPCPARFAPDACKHFALIYVVETDEEAANILPSWHQGNWGLMSYDHDTREDHRCTIVMLRERLGIPLIVHELTHAALEWVHGVSLPAAAEHEDDIEEYCSECMARVMEQMTSDALTLINRNT